MPALQAQFTITVNDKDVSQAFESRLISLEVSLDDKGNLDSGSIEIDDHGGEVLLPSKGASVEISLGWTDTGICNVFTGFVDSVKSSLARDKGHRLTIAVKSGDMSGKLKERMSDSKDDASFSDVLKEWGQKAGLEMHVDSDVGSIQKPWWCIDNESFMAFAERHTHEVGATFKVVGSKGVVVSRKGGKSVNGQALLPVSVKTGDGGNLIDISASPILSRPDFGPTSTRYYDPIKAQWMEESGKSGSSSTVTHRHPFKAADKDGAKRQSDSNGDELDREKGGADSVTITGEPLAQPCAPCSILGVRDGVDGDYLISTVSHTLSRSDGFRTKLGLKQPGKGVGEDGRKSSGKS